MSELFPPVSIRPPFSVRELTYRIKELLETKIGEVSVEGEISNLRNQSSGHLYFTLKDAEAQLSVVFFRGDTLKLNFVPRDGMLVVAKGEISVYPPRGNYQLRVFSLQLKGKGTLQEQFEALKRKLEQEGLFSPERKKEFPYFPEKIGLITSPTGAAIQDFMQILERRCPRLQVQLIGTRVQGLGAAEEIAAAVQEFNRRGEVDVIVLVRGGGSLEDLWAFNEEIVARAVAASAIPTISGVGHEIDFTICDLAADLRAPTPSAAAELVSRPDAEWTALLDHMRSMLHKASLDHLRESRWSLNHLANSYVFREPRRIVSQWMQIIDDKQEQLNQAIRLELERRQNQFDVLCNRWKTIHPKIHFKDLRQKLQHFKERVRLLSPQTTLDRGYAIVFDAKGHVIQSRQQAIKAKDLFLRLNDGDVAVKVKNDS